MLKVGTFKQGLEFSRDGKAEISLPEDDLEAFTIALNAIHDRGSKILRIVDIKLIVQNIILVDKYHMVEAGFSDH